jgi:ankyrin repeat protein
MLRILVVIFSLTIIIILTGCQPRTEKLSGPQPARSTENKPPPTRAELAMLRDAAVGDTAAVKGWLEKGVNVNMRGDSLNTPIMEAAFAGHLETVKLLLDHGADLSAKKIDGETPVSLGAGHQDIAELFKDVLALTDAASKGDNKAVKELIEKGTPLNGLDQFGQSPLTEASWNGRTDTVKLLLGKGADPNIKKPDGQSPLSIAMGQNRPDIVVLLNAAIAKQSKEIPKPAGK